MTTVSELIQPRELIGDTGLRPHSPLTRAVHGHRQSRRPHPHHALTTPIVQTATYTFKNSADLCAFMEAKMWGNDPEMAERGEYGRYGNPTVRSVEKRLATLEEGDDALLFPTGMAAITNVLLSILPAGAHVIFTDDCYRKTRQFCNSFLRRFGIETSQVPVGDYAALEQAIQANTRLIISESPTNPYLRVVDLERLADIAHRHRVKTLIDATFATPINVRPLQFGIDLVIHSATKYLSGHNDIMAGVAVGEAGLIHALRQSQGMLGGVLDPHAAALLERGLKTLALRVRQQNQTTQSIASYLETHPKIEQVWYPGLSSHPDYAIAQAQMSGFGGVVSFTIKPIAGETPLATTSRFIDAVTIPLIAPSLGGVESLIEQPALMSYYELSTEERLAIGVRDNLVRLAVGIEDENDILTDLEQALAQI
ncbi:MAG: aminotransferase class I/II-fold pyridoxal phosphate-dependent enzyme [Anaerolineae bacterium]|nr:aminotransferase class I/II-fold pyridoxal phosphate-dependent enzyme [Anaerolineae bacterium]